MQHDNILLIITLAKGKRSGKGKGRLSITNWNIYNGRELIFPSDDQIFLCFSVTLPF